MQGWIGPNFGPEEAREFDAFLSAALDPGGQEEEIVYEVLEVEGTLAGCGGFEVLEGCGYLCWGIVDRARTGQGLGRAILERRLELLKAWPVERVFCDTAPVTEAFYARFGFKTFFRKPDHWSAGIDLAAMELSWNGLRRGRERLRSDGSIGYRLISS
jgi:GNAT superfamily N-acetyltransferase